MVEGDGQLPSATVPLWTRPCCVGLAFFREGRILFHLVGFVSAPASEPQELEGPIPFCLSVHLFIPPPRFSPSSPLLPSTTPSMSPLQLPAPCGPPGKETQTRRRPGAAEALWDWELSERWNGAPLCRSFELEKLTEPS